MYLKITTDGSAGPANPGNMAIGYFIRTPDGIPLVAARKRIGIGTCNQAEYYAVLYGLKRCLKLKATEVDLFVDSQLVHNQLTGIYSVKSNRLRSVYMQCRILADSFNSFKVTWHRRSNGDSPIADALAGFKDPAHVAHMINKKYMADDWSGIEEVGEDFDILRGNYGI